MQHEGTMLTEEGGRYFVCEDIRVCIFKSFTDSLPKTMP